MINLFQHCLQEVEGVLAGNVLIEFAIGLKVAPVQKGRGGGAGARYNFEENDVNCKRSLVAAERLVAQEHLFQNIFFPYFLHIWSPHNRLWIRG